MRRRKEWFARTVDVYLVLWWLPTGGLPYIVERNVAKLTGKRQMRYLTGVSRTEFAVSSFPPSLWNNSAARVRGVAPSSITVPSPA